MLDFSFVIAFSFTIAIAAIIGIVRYKFILKSYRPFLFFTWFALASEILNLISVKMYESTEVNSNIYTLVEFILILWLFFQWNRANNAATFYPVLLIAGVAVWILDNLILYSIRNENSIFRIFYSLVFVYLSIAEINQLLFRREKHILYNSKFIICVGFLVYFSYKATFEIFFLVHMGWSNDFYKRLFTIFVFVNLLSNILYALAVLCIPRKQKFILYY